VVFLRACLPHQTMDALMQYAHAVAMVGLVMLALGIVLGAMRAR
jgi:hypothetical protein